MREILFRGKSKGKPEWVYGSLYKEGPQAFILVGGRFYPEPSNGQSALGIMDWYEVFHDSIGQFTGLTDKNGNKIFEGDILKITWSNESFKDGVMKTSVIFWQGNFCHSGSMGPLWPHIIKDKYEVIGNIHDNPELLEEK